MTPAETVDAFMAAINAMDLDSATALLSEDCEYDNVPMNKMFGRATIHERLSPMMDDCEALEWITIRQAATDHLVLNERMDRFKWPSGWLEMPCAGVFEVHDGLITLWRDYFDLPTYKNQMEALGIARRPS